MIKRCIDCKKEFKFKMGNYKYCNSCSDKHQSKSYQKAGYLKLWQESRTIEVYKSLGGKCNKCGFKDIRAMQIHHKDGNKERKRDWMNKTYNLNKIELLCANCHCIITHNTNKYGYTK